MIASSAGISAARSSAVVTTTATYSGYDKGKSVRDAPETFSGVIDKCTADSDMFAFAMSPLGVVLADATLLAVCEKACLAATEVYPVREGSYSWVARFA